MNETSAGSASTGLPPLPAWAHEPLPDFSGYQNVTAKKDAFFQFLFPRIALANQRILILRGKLEEIERKDSLDDADREWLAQQAERLRVDAPMGSKSMFEQLDRRLDIVPPSLVLAQAANESAWGTSRFAQQGNNLFGQWCFSPGCGIVPNRRGEDQRHEVASFESPYQSVRGYITNLNRHQSYQSLREKRSLARDQNEFPTGTMLARGLTGYSERGQDYINEIISMMRYNSLEFYDELFRELEKDPKALAPQKLAERMIKRRG
ncbi:glucosaminidase domain-containing protein [Marinobacteraceae bacterium S3BR75-40.1]